MTNATASSDGLSRDTVSMMKFEASKKSMGLAYVLWFFLGMLGAHRFYLGRNGSGAAILILTILAIPLSFIGIGFLLLLVPSIWVLVDLFLIPGIVRTHNMKLISALQAG